MFVAVPADTIELQREAFRLRYQVYCVEHCYEDPARNPDGMERDEFDDHAVHGLLRHRATQATVGTVRLVLHPRGAQVGSLPIHRVCLDTRVHDEDLLPLQTTFEVSRFAISKQFRRRASDRLIRGEGDAGGLDCDPARTVPYICLGLMTAALQMGLANGIEVVCAIMEPALLRLMARFGFHFVELGSPVWHHGWRQPVYAPVAAMLRTVRQERPDIWGMMTDRGRLWPARFESENAEATASFATSLS